MLGRVDVVASLLRQIAKVGVAYITFNFDIEGVKDFELVPWAQLDFKILHAELKLVKWDSVVEIEVKEAECLTKALETLKNSQIAERKIAI